MGETSTQPHNPHSHMTPPPIRIAALAPVLALLGSLFLASCASTTKRPPSPGMARIDATPDAKYRDRIDDIRVTKLNGTPVRGTDLEVQPGKNRMRLGFNWPQGGDQEVDLEFNARPNTKYFVRYDVHPPYTERLGQTGILDATTGEIFAASSGTIADVFLTIPAGVVMGGAAMATRLNNEIAEDSRAANYVDVMVIAQHSSQGVVCTRRVYPDGRTENR